MVPVIDGKVAFSRDQVVSSTQASKNFGEMRRRAKSMPLYVSDRNDGIGTVIVDFAEFEAMAVEIENLREAVLRQAAASRVERAEANPDHEPIPLREVVGDEALETIMNLDTEGVSDSELFE